MSFKLPDPQSITEHPDGTYSRKCPTCNRVTKYEGPCARGSCRGAERRYKNECAQCHTLSTHHGGMPLHYKFSTYAVDWNNVNPAGLFLNDITQVNICDGEMANPNQNRLDRVTLFRVMKVSCNDCQYERIRKIPLIESWCVSCWRCHSKNIILSV